MNPKLTRTSATTCTLTFPTDEHCGETSYVIEYDPYLQRWAADSTISNRMPGRARSLDDIVRQLVRYDRLIRVNLRLSELEAQIAEAQTYLDNGDDQ